MNDSLRRADAQSAAKGEAERELVEADALMRETLKKHYEHNSRVSRHYDELYRSEGALCAALESVLKVARAAALPADAAPVSETERKAVEWLQEYDKQVDGLQGKMRGQLRELCGNTRELIAELLNAVRAATPDAVTDAESHPEDSCKRCHRPNISWFAPNDLWNQYARDRNEPGILCPICFVQIAEQNGLSTTKATGIGEAEEKANG